MKILPYLVLPLVFSTAQADDVYNSATRVLTAPVVSVDGQNYTNANILLGADGRWSLLDITPPSASASVAEKCTTANINLTNFKRISNGLDLAQVTSIIGCKPDKSVNRTATSNLYWWYLNGSYSFISIGITFDQHDKNAYSLWSQGF